VVEHAVNVRRPSPQPGCDPVARAARTLRGVALAPTTREGSSIPDRLGRWWPVAGGLSAALLIWVFWSQTYAQRIDFHIYVDSVRHWTTSSAYNYHDPVLGLGFTYPPAGAMVLWPLAQLGEAAGEHLWLVGSVLASAAFLVLGIRMLPTEPATRWYRPALLALCIWSVPVVLTTRLGQINAYLALAVLADVLLCERGWRRSGFMTGVAAAVKLTPGIGLLYFAVAGKRRALVNGIVAAAAITATAALLAPSESRFYWTDALFDTGRIGDLDSAYSNSIRRMAAWLPFGDRAQNVIWVLCCVVLIVVATRRAGRAVRVGNHLAAIVIVMCLGGAISPISWTHHLYFLILALPLLVGDGRSAVRVVLAVATLPILFEWGHDFGQRPTTTALRALALVLVVFALPIDEPDVAPSSAPDARTVASRR
jgi:alpha-1,2-mannosyltransferase